MTSRYSLYIWSNFLTRNLKSEGCEGRCQLEFWQLYAANTSGVPKKHFKHGLPWGIWIYSIDFCLLTTIMMMVMLAMMVVMMLMKMVIVMMMMLVWGGEYVYGALRVTTPAESLLTSFFVHPIIHITIHTIIILILHILIIVILIHRHQCLGRGGGFAACIL